LAVTALDAARAALAEVGRLTDEITDEAAKPPVDQDQPWFADAVAMRDQMARDATTASVVALAEAVAQFAAAFHDATQLAIAHLTLNGDPSQ
jgi:hypothetical protein